MIQERQVLRTFRSSKTTFKIFFKIYKDKINLKQKKIMIKRSIVTGAKNCCFIDFVTPIWSLSLKCLNLLNSLTTVLQLWTKYNQLFMQNVLGIIKNFYGSFVRRKTWEVLIFCSHENKPCYVPGMNKSLPNWLVNLIIPKPTKNVQTYSHEVTHIWNNKYNFILRAFTLFLNNKCYHNRMRP